MESQRSKSLSCASGFVVLAWLCGSGLAQSGGGYDLTWNTTDSGGPVAGGGFELDSTIGTAAAGEVSGGGYELDGGFVAGEGGSTDCGESQAYGDVEPPLCPSSSVMCDPVEAGDCDVDVDDILLTLDDFSGLISPAQVADIEPCNSSGVHGDGDTDVDDILSVLDAFSGTVSNSDCVAPCPGCP